MPLVVRGESKEVRRAPGGRVAIQFLPTVYSYTANRCGEIPGTDSLRVRASAALVKLLRRHGIGHAYESFDDNIVIAKEVSAPPIEVIVKGRHVGTPKHRYFGMAQWPTRTGGLIGPGTQYAEPMVRFDWRNPLRNPDTQQRLADEVMPNELANEFIDVGRARVLAMRVWNALTAGLKSVDIELVDICLSIDVTGDVLFGELSPDCARFQCRGDGLDKDVWRSGGSAELVLERWTQFVTRAEAIQ